MTRAALRPMLAKRALRLNQAPGSQLYVFSLTAPEISRLTDISRVSRDERGDLIGYQRPEVRQHVQEIVDYLDSDEVIFPNAIIIALPSTVHFSASRGPQSGKVSDDDAGCTGILQIPLPVGNEAKPGWIVDGQQRTVALDKAQRQDLSVLVTAFVADNVEVQRDQFVRINNTKPLPRGLVTELLPTISSPLSPRLAIKQAPSELCDLLNKQEPFEGLIRRPSTPGDERTSAVITDSSVVAMLQESLAGGSLFVYRDMSSGETDYLSVIKAVTLYWTCVRDTFPDAWGRPPEESRLMHGAGIRAMGKLMDWIMRSLDLEDESTPKQVMDELALVAPHCRWTDGIWDGLGLKWNAIQNNSRHISELSNHLLRLYTHARTARR
ncbi:DGQHR domain-containing protein DpdB [uncultured Jatrophihabitans sp.]|uniref:DGQHR domain-containing protein DpdB n=1 Tax=uncultured Jatrophihabitans sp. TaxID=1610747 RepID=UPI0035CA0166